MAQMLSTNFKYDGEWYDVGTLSRGLPKEVREAAKELDLLVEAPVVMPDEEETPTGDESE